MHTHTQTQEDVTKWRDNAVSTQEQLHHTQNRVDELEQTQKQVSTLKARIEQLNSESEHSRQKSRTSNSETESRNERDVHQRTIEELQAAVKHAEHERDAERRNVAYLQRNNAQLQKRVETLHEAQFQRTLTQNQACLIHDCEITEQDAEPENDNHNHNNSAAPSVRRRVSIGNTRDHNCTTNANMVEADSQQKSTLKLHTPASTTAVKFSGRENSESESLKTNQTRVSAENDENKRTESESDQNDSIQNSAAAELMVKLRTADQELRDAQAALARADEREGILLRRIGRAQELLVKLR
jgi:hypothetical protein